MLKTELKKLSQDLLTFLKEEGHLIEKKVFKETPLPPPKPKPMTRAPEPLPPAPALKPKQVPRQETTPIFDQIKKHLPHVRLTQTIPSQKKVALVVYDKEDLPFLKNLAKAIQERFCPVSLIDGAKVEEGKDWDLYTLVLSQKGGSVNADIFLEPSSVYTAKGELKKQLWNAICTRLSPKSS